MKTTTFYIYEVPGHKNGCTQDWKNRSQYNFQRYNIMPVLVETYNYPDEAEYWQIVGDREWELAEKNGYAKGPHYRIAREQRILAQKIGCISGGKIQGPILGKINVESGHMANIRILANQKNQERIKCIHCGLECNRINHGKWHGDKCKQKNK